MYASYLFFSKIVVCYLGVLSTSGTTSSKALIENIFYNNFTTNLSTGNITSISDDLIMI